MQRFVVTAKRILVLVAVLAFVPALGAGWAASGRQVTVPAGADIQAAIDANPEGTTFQLEAGTYPVAKTIKPKAGDVLVGAGRGLTILDGGTSSFNGIDSTKVSGAQVLSLTLQHFYDALGLGPGSLAQGVETGANARDGVRITGDGAIVNGSYVHDSGRFGIFVNRASSVQVVGNQLVHNHTSSAWSNGYAGGIKVMNFNSGVLVQDNVVTGTIGKGIWTDNDANGTQVVSNTVLGSTEEGIRVEISFSTLVQQNVTDTGIRVVNSSDTLVESNQTAALGTSSPLSFLGNGRTNSAGVEYVNANNRASSNDVKLASGQKVGVFRVAGTTYGNSFDADTYHAPSAATKSFKWWTGTASQTLSWSGWQGVGQDVSGTVGP